MWECGVCRESNQDETEFCRHCGASRNREQESALDKVFREKMVTAEKPLHEGGVCRAAKRMESAGQGLFVTAVGLGVLELILTLAGTSLLALPANGTPVLRDMTFWSFLGGAARCAAVIFAGWVADVLLEGLAVMAEAAEKIRKK